MAYSDFTVGKVKQAFGLQTIEGKSFFPTIVPVAPSSTLVEVLDENLPLKGLFLRAAFRPFGQTRLDV